MEKCITTKGGGSVNGFALILLCVFGLAAVIVLSLGHPAFMVGGGAAAIVSMFRKLIPK